MSRVRVHAYPGADYYAERNRHGWMVHGLSFWGPTLFYPHEIERVPAHRSEYDPDHWAERDEESAELYDNCADGVWAARYRKEGAAN